jgi:iron complex outermembrane receptor protein
LNHDFKLNTGINYTFYQADIQVYKGLKTQNQGGVFLSILKYFKKIDWSLNLNLRQELIEGYEVPFSPSLGLEGKIWKNIGGKLNFSKNFRVPTMNDRFWQPGGNENLKPESSLSGEGSLFYKSKKIDKKLTSEFIATYYYSLIDNWIEWKPTQNSYWGPQNLRKVKSSGIEFEGKTRVKLGKFSAVLSEAYTYASSINMDSSSNTDESFKKQLIYIPENKAFVQILLLYKSFGISYNHSYTGIRYTNPENTKFLPENYLGNLKLEAGIPFKSFNLKAEFHINNLWNTSYQAIEWRPMPQQNYLVKLTLSFKQ